jgi:hypothetical protein
MARIRQENQGHDNQLAGRQPFALSPVRGAVPRLCVSTVLYSNSRTFAVAEFTHEDLLLPAVSASSVSRQ